MDPSIEAPGANAGTGREGQFRTLVELAPDVIYHIATDGRFVSLSPAFQEITGWSPAEWEGRPFADIIHPHDLPLALENFRAVLKGVSPPPFELRVRSRSGSYLVGEFRSMPRFEDGRVTGTIGVARDITDRKRAEQDLQSRIRQQAAVAQLGQQALDTIDLPELFDRAVRLIATTLDVEFCTILERLPGSEKLLVRAGVGWPPGTVGQIFAEAGTGSPAGYTVYTGQPVLFEDLAEETRFSIPEIGQAMGVVSGANVIIDGRGGPWGVLGALSNRRRAFENDDVHFLQATANALAAVIQRSQVEEQLQRSRDQLEIILQGVDDGITVQDRDGHLIYANATAARLVGCSSVQELLDIQGVDSLNRFEILDGEGNPFDPENFPGRKILRGEPAREVELSIRTPGSHEVRWSIVSATPVYDAAGNIQLAINVFRDVTEHRQADEVRRRMAAIVQSSSDAIIGKDLDAIIIDWNRAAERLYGYSPAEILGKSVAVLVPPDRPGELPGIMAQIKAGQRIEHFETVRVRKDGQRLDVSISVSPIRNAAGRVIGAATIARNITDLKQAEAERAALLEREQAARFRAEAAQRRVSFLAEASQILAGSLDFETTLANVARLAVPHVGDWCIIDLFEEDGSVRRIALTHPDPAKVQYARELEQRYPADPTSDSGMNALLTTGESRFYPHITDEMLTLAAGDEDHLTILRALGLKSVMMVALTARERILGALTLISAESGRHFTDEDLAMAEDLGRRAGVAVDNARLYQQAQDALRLREEFLSIASHELKTPLTALQLQMQILDRATAEGRLADLPQQRVERMLDGARRQMRRLSKLVNDLLDVSRIAAGRTELEKSRFDLVELTNQVIDRFREESVMARVPISLTSDQPVIGSWDRFQIDQVITNLLSNAVKYGEGKPVEVRVESDGERARLNVFDRGLGIAPEHLSLVFERFERVSLSQSYGGLGLGLYISRQIVEAHGGTIRAESTAGEGTAFIVELPLEA